MKRILPVSVCGWALVAASLGMGAQTMQTAKPADAAGKAAYYIDPAGLGLERLIADPPAVTSAANDAELSELHRIEAARTAEQVAAAKADENQEDMFAYKTVLGPGFNPEALPVTAELGVHVKSEQSVEGGELKQIFHRPRPYQTDKTLHPVCQLTEAPNSYPSGHALTGYLEGFTLAELVPAKRADILARADDYARNRMVCGVHYPSDIEASRRVAYAIFGAMMTTPKFQHDLAAARAEIQAMRLAGK